MAKSNIQRRYVKKSASSSNVFITTAPKVLSIMIITGLLLLLISAFIASKSASPLRLTGALPLFSLYCCSFIGGFFCAKLIESPGSYLCAAASSALFTLFILVLKFFIPQSTTVPKPAASIALHSLIVLFSLLGVITSERLPQRRKSRRKSTGVKK